VYKKLASISTYTLKNRLAGHIKVLGGPHVARRPDFAQPWTRENSLSLSVICTTSFAPFKFILIFESLKAELYLKLFNLLNLNFSKANNFTNPLDFQDQKSIFIILQFYSTEEKISLEIDIFPIVKNSRLTKNYSFFLPSWSKLEFLVIKCIPKVDLIKLFILRYFSLALS